MTEKATKINRDDRGHYTTPKCEHGSDKQSGEVVVKIKIATVSHPKGANVREKPGGTAKVVKTILNGVPVPYYEIRGDWVKVLGGYINKGRLTL
jgi:hypothetical protein